MEHLSFGSPCEVFIANAQILPFFMYPYPCKKIIGKKGYIYVGDEAWDNEGSFLVK